MATRCFAYVRVSSEGQVDKTGLPRQRKAIERFASQGRSYEIVEWFEEAFTGTEDKRPSYVRMLDEMKRQDVSVILIECMDRFARDLAVQSLLLAQLTTLGHKLIPVDQGIDVVAAYQSKGTNRAIIQIMGVISELVKNQLVDRMHQGRIASGNMGGQPRFGEREGEMEVVELIRKLRRKPVKDERRSYQEVSRELNRRGIKTRHGKRWACNTVINVCKWHNIK
jgi:DNA invertase Pin-like site-specific DNA recombinase